MCSKGCHAVGHLLTFQLTSRSKHMLSKQHVMQALHYSLRLCLLLGIHTAYLASVVDEELLVHHPVIWLQAAVKELRADIKLDAVGLP